MLALCLGLVSTADAGAAARGCAYLSVLEGPLYRVSFTYDGSGGLNVSAPIRVANLARGGSVRVLPNGNVVVAGAGVISLLDVHNHQVSRVSSQNNGNTAVLGPGAATLWVGWKDTALSIVPLNPLANGTPHGVGGDDSVATMIAFTPADGVFYSTGGEFENGNIGKINLSTFTTMLTGTAVFATGIVYDTYSQSLISAGLGRARQYTPSTPTVVQSQRDDSLADENYLVLEPNGAGHLLGTRSGAAAQMVLIDYSATGRIGDAASVLSSVPIPALSGLSGALGIDSDLIYREAFEPVPQSP